MAGEEGAAFSAGRKIFCHCYGVDEDSTVVVGKGRLLLILAGTMKTPLLPLHGSEHVLLLLPRGAVVLSSDCGEGRLLVQGLARRIFKHCFN